MQLSYRACYISLWIGASKIESLIHINGIEPHDVSQVIMLFAR